MNIAIVFAGGSGVRMGAAVPKQFLEIDGKCVLAWTLGLFESHPDVDGIVVVAQPEHFARIEALCRDEGIAKLVKLCAGGETAQDSIYNGLTACAALYPPDTVVLLHDGVRPYVEAEVISRNIAAARDFGSAVTITPCYETIVISSDGTKVDALPRRAESYTAQAPQSFRLGEVLSAHEEIRARPGGYKDMVDQATIYKTLGRPVRLVEGSRGNIKVTTPEDLAMLGALLRLKRGAR